MAKFDWASDNETTRAHTDGTRNGDDRRPFARDRDRILHAAALRKLQGKTQVFPSHWADPMRTRLTHTLEVMQIGRSIARNIGLSEDLVEAVCLAHDLGHPPFGHVGERALQERMLEHGGFDANAQTLRILTQLARKPGRSPGLNLTRATLRSVVKYPYPRIVRETLLLDGLPSGDARDEYLRRAALTDHRGELVATKDFLYEETLAAEVSGGQSFQEWLYDGTSLSLLADERLARPPQTLACQVMDWADDAAYSIHDLEDGIEAGFVDLEDVVKDEFVELIAEDVLARVEAASRKPLSSSEVAKQTVQTVLTDLKTHVRMAEEDLGGDRRLAVRRVTRQYLHDFIVKVDVGELNPADGSLGYELVVPESERVRAEVLKAIVIERVLKDERVARYLYKGRQMLQRTFDALVKDVALIDDSAGQLLPRDVRAALRTATAGGETLHRAVCDYLASMTERELTELYQTLFESTGGRPLR